MVLMAWWRRLTFSHNCLLLNFFHLIFFLQFSETMHQWYYITKVLKNTGFYINQSFSADFLVIRTILCIFISFLGVLISLIGRILHILIVSYADSLRRRLPEYHTHHFFPEYEDWVSYPDLFNLYRWNGGLCCWFYIIIFQTIRSLSSCKTSLWVYACFRRGNGY